MAEGIAVALVGFSEDEGAAVAVRKAERWRDALEEMQEVANDEQRRAIARLLEPVRVALGFALAKAPRRAKRGRG